MSPEPTPRRAIRIVSQCATKDDFVAVFHPYLGRDGLFVATASPEETGARLHFVMTLAGGEAILRGAGVVVESHRSRSNFYGLRGMKLRFDELDGASRNALRAVEAGPRRHPSAPAAPGRSPNEMVECLIYDDPGTEPREPLGSGVDAGAEPSDPGNLMSLTGDDDVTAVAVAPPPPPAPAGNGPHGRLPGFTVPRPRTDPALATNPRTQRVSMSQMAQLDTEQMPELKPAHAETPPAPAAGPAPAPIPSPPRLPEPDDSAPPARRGKGTAPSAAVEQPHPHAPIEPKPVAPPPGEMVPDIARSTMRLPPAEPRRPPSAPGGGGDRFRHESSPPEYAGGEFTPPPGMPLTPNDPLLPLVRQPGAPRRPMAPQATITPTEIVSPLALDGRTGTERRRGRSPMASERTDVVRVSYVRTAAVSATLGALLGLAAGYLLWGLNQEARPALVVPDQDGPASAPAPNEAPPEAKTVPAGGHDAGPDQASPPLDAAPAAAAAAPARTPAPSKPALRRRRR